MDKLKFVGIIASIIIVSSCEDAHYSTHKVVSKGDCTEPTGGWGGMEGRCRVIYEDGGKGTIVRPVDVGDTVICVVSANGIEYACRVR